MDISALDGDSAGLEPGHAGPLPPQNKWGRSRVRMEVLLAVLHEEGFLLLDTHSPAPLGARAGTGAPNCKIFVI